jgi:hypothetical protein
MELSFPKWKDEWQRCFKPLAIIGLLTDLVSFLLPNIPGHWCLRLVLLPVIVLSPPLAGATVLWIAKAISVAFRRIRWYPRIQNNLVVAHNVLQVLSHTIEKERRFEILSVQFYNDRIYISIKRKRRPKLENGARLAVVTPSEYGRREMGVFVICEAETNSERYLAYAQKIDALWLGYIRSQGEREVSPPLHSFAFLCEE